MPVLGRQVTVVLRAHATLFLVDAALLPFQVACFARSQLPAAHALPDALLLIAFSLCNMVTLSRCGLCRRTKRQSRGQSEGSHLKSDCLACHGESFPYVFCGLSALQLPHTLWKNTQLASVLRAPENLYFPVNSQLPFLRGVAAQGTSTSFSRKLTTPCPPACRVPAKTTVRTAPLPAFRLTVLTGTATLVPATVALTVYPVPAGRST